MKKTSFSSGALLILLAGIFWGSMGIFVRALGRYGFSPLQITAARLSFAALGFGLILRLREPGGFALRTRDIPLFLGLGWGSILFFTVCYFTAITIMPLSTAAILLYTSPIWVTLLSVLLFGERLSGRKLLALALAFGGCVLVSGLGGGGLRFTALLIGLGSGLGYGLYSILGSIALRRYSPYAVTCWTFLLAAVGSWPLCAPGDFLEKLRAAPSPAALLLLLALTAVVTAVIPFLAYTLGLRRVEASRAAILATVEPLMATLLGVFLFREKLGLLSLAGIALILAAVLLLNLPAKPGRSSSDS